MFLPFRGVCPAFTECSGRWGQREEASRGSVRQALVQEACLGCSSEALEVLQARRQPEQQVRARSPHHLCVFLGVALLASPIITSCLAACLEAGVGCLVWPSQRACSPAAAPAVCPWLL